MVHERLPFLAQMSLHAYQFTNYGFFRSLRRAYGRLLLLTQLVQRLCASDSIANARSCGHSWKEAGVSGWTNRYTATHRVCNIGEGELAFSQIQIHRNITTLFVYGG